MRLRELLRNFGLGEQLRQEVAVERRGFALRGLEGRQLIPAQ